MKYEVFKKELSKKTISVLIVICFSTISINQCLANSGSQDDTSVYGFIVSSVKLENVSLEYQIDCKIRHMINDLLREKISAYWTAENFTTEVKKIHDGEISEDEIELFFERGTFVIPFTGNSTNDKKIVAMIYDYNESSEIEDSNIKIPVYLLMNPLTIVAHRLSEVKIAQMENLLTGISSYYVESSKACGFLTFDCIEDKDLGKKLKNTDYNVVIYPGAIPNYGLAFVHMSTADLKLNSPSKAVRNFVAKGGGYIGSCYGAYTASCGMFPSYLKRAYNPNLRSFVLLAISDILIVFTHISRTAELRIANNTHPVTYGLDSIILTLHLGGPRIVYVGKNSQAIAFYQETNSVLDGTPCWISSGFGNGRVMIFTGHPEIYTYDLEGRPVGDKIISNALYYTTCDDNAELQMSQSRNLSFILKIWEITENLTSGVSEQEELFKEIKMKINESINILNGMGRGWTSYGLYLTDSMKTLTTIEKIYPLLKNNTNFIQSLTAIKNDLSAKVNETKVILLKVPEKLQRCKKIMDLINLNPFGLFFRSKLLIYNQISLRYNHLSNEITRSLPQIYFDSLKFLRHHWYNYESSIEII